MVELDHQRHPSGQHSVQHFAFAVWDTRPGSNSHCVTINKGNLFSTKRSDPAIGSYFAGDTEHSEAIGLVTHIREPCTKREYGLCTSLSSSSFKTLQVPCKCHRFLVVFRNISQLQSWLLVRHILWPTCWWSRRPTLSIQTPSIPQMKKPSSAWESKRPCRPLHPT